MIVCGSTYCHECHGLAERILPRNTVARRPIRRVLAPNSALPGFKEGVFRTSISYALAAAVVLNSVSVPLLFPSPASPADINTNHAALQHLTEQLVASSGAPDVHAAPTDPQNTNWWQADADAWLELTTPAELSAFLTSSVPAPAWPYHDNDALTPKLRVVEFYATWCPACRAAAPGMAAVAKDPQLQSTCTFARANADRVKPLLKQLGITKIPTAVIISPDGHVLDVLRASGQVVREAVIQQAATLTRAATGAVPSPPPPPAGTDEQQASPPDEINELMTPSEINGGTNAEHQTTPGSTRDTTTTTSSSSSSSTAATITTGGDGDTHDGVSSSVSSSAACGLVPHFSTCGSSPTTATTSSSSSQQHAPASPPTAAVTSAATPPSLESAKRDFLHQYGGDYGYQGWLAAHYDSEVGSRLGRGHHYLDYTGAALYPSSLLQAVFSHLMTHTYGNPHSLTAAAPGSSTALNTPTAAAGSGGGGGGVVDRVAPAAASELAMQSAALTVLQHMNADPAQYQVVFTRSATEALKLVGEMFPWTTAAAAQGGSSSSSDTHVSSEGANSLQLQMLQPHYQQQQQQGSSTASDDVSDSSSSSNSSVSQFIYTRSNHNSVLGVGAYAAAAGARLVSMTDLDMHHWLEQQQQQASIQQAQQQLQISLKQLFSGKFKQDDQQQSQQGVSSTPFITSSSGSDPPRYHLIAYPAEDNFAGVMYPLDWINQAHTMSSPSERYLVLLDAAAHLPTHSLDLTAHPADFVALSFYKMFGYPTGLGALLLRTELVPLLNKVYFGGGSVSLSTPEDCWHVLKCDPGQALTDGTPNYLGAAAVQMAYENWDSRGGVQGAIFNFQVLESDGSPVSYLTVEREAAAAGIDLRSGCVCNPGACYDALGLHADEVQGLAGVKEGCGDDVELVTVMRPAATGDSASSKTVGSLLSKGAPGSDEQQQFAATQIPLGSVRASLGWASTFEDVFMFVEFLKGYIT